MLLALTVALALAVEAPARGEGPTPGPQPAAEAVTPAAPSGDEATKEATARSKYERERRRADREELLDMLLPEAAVAPPRVRGGGICYAPAGTEEGSGFGAEFYRVGREARLAGGGLWFAGSLETPDIDAPIPVLSRNPSGWQYARAAPVRLPLS
jgi:hypothetical protein